MTDTVDRPGEPLYAIDQEIAQLRDLLADVPVDWLAASFAETDASARLDALEAVARFAADAVAGAVLRRFSDDIPALVLHLTARDRLEIEPLRRLRERLESLRNTRATVPDPATVVARVLALGLDEGERQQVRSTLRI